MALLVLVSLTGCEGRNLTSDDAVFSVLPPRRSLVNNATKLLPGKMKAGGSDIVQVSATSSTDVLSGNTVVAVVNGQPIFVDDIAGSIRVTLDAAPELTDGQRQQILRKQLQARISQRIDEEIVLHALHQKVPEEQREGLKEHLSAHFERYLVTIREGVEVESDEEFEQKLAQQGMSIGLLRETFFRIQMVNGYVESLAEQHVPAPPSRLELFEYYQNHIAEFTPEERLRWQEIRISRTQHGGESGSRERLSMVVQALKAGDTEFDTLAREYSDSASADENGNKGWLTRGDLADRKLEQTLFGLDTGQLSKVIESDRYLSIYRVARHEHAEARSFEAVQDEIKSSIQQGMVQDAKRQVIEDLREKASIRSIFDDETAG